MFGYVKPYKPQLRIAEYEAYKGIYCGLCHQLGRSFGPLARMTLSYDFAFLASLGIALGEDKPTFQPKSCIASPLKKCPCCAEQEVISFSADVAMLMLYHKLRDNQKDSGFWGKLGATLALVPTSPAYHKAAQRQPQAADAIAAAMLKQYTLESEGCDSVDAAAEPTAQVLSTLCAMLDDGPQKRVLERLGYFLGRYVYLIDALDDLEDDLKSGSYNVFVAAHNLTISDHDRFDEIRREAMGSLYLTLAEVGRAYDLLEIKHLGGILENIVFLGLKQGVDSIMEERK